MFILSKHDSIFDDLLPVIQDDLKNKGFSLVSIRSDNDSIEIQNRITCVSVLVGKKIAKRVTIALLEDSEQEEVLPVHTEGIYGKNGICPFFSLGCVKPSNKGGYTRIYDGRKAAELLKERHPSVARARIYYRSLSHPQEGAEYSVVHSSDEHEDVLRFRDEVVSNDFIPSDEYPPKEVVYEKVNSVLDECVTVNHTWNKGDILFVNNKITLHDREPFVGKRCLVRIRMDEPARTTFTY